MKTKLLTAWITFSWIGTVVLLSIQPALAQRASSRSLESIKEDLPQSFKEYLQRSEDAADRSQNQQAQDAAADWLQNQEVQQQAQDTAATVQTQQVQKLQGQNIDAAVAKFRTQQQQRLQGQNQPLSPSTPVQVGPAPIQ